MVPAATYVRVNELHILTKNSEKRSELYFHVLTLERYHKTSTRLFIIKRKERVFFFAQE